MPNQLSVLYSTVISMMGDNGGSLVCREHVQRLAAVDSVDLHVCVIEPLYQTAGSGTFVNSLGAKYHPIEFTPAVDISDIRWSLGSTLAIFTGKIALSKVPKSTSLLIALSIK